MRSISISHVLVGFIISVAVLVLVIPERVDARGRLGGGGISRGGPAAGGSIRTRPATRPATRPTTRPSTQRPSSSNIRDNRVERRDNVRDNKHERREVRHDNRGERREVRHDVRHERRERHEWYEDRWKRRAIGAAITISAYSALSCTRKTVYIGGVTYYRCGSDWYQRAYRGTEVVYIVVQAPSGY